MKAVILAGGLGTRMGEETVIRPKPMIEIGGKPILWHIMKIYSCHGINDFIVCLGYKGEIIKEYFFNYEMLTRDFTVRLGKPRQIEVHGGPEDDWSVTLADTGNKTLKGARLKRIEKYVDGDVFLLTYGDGVADINVRDLLDFHRRHGRLATVTGVKPPSRFGELTVRGSRVVLFHEKPQTSAGLINGGFFVLGRKIFESLTTDDNCDFEKSVLADLASNGELMVYEHKGQWECMDTPRDVEHLNAVWHAGNAFWKMWK